MHRALATVNLESIRHNLASLQGRLSPGTSLMAVVKADGYGHGAAEVARAAQEAGAAALGVATAGEAVSLRDAGIEGPIVVLGPLTGAGLEAAVHAGAEVTLWSEQFIRELVRVGRVMKHPIRVHIKVDTGMHRLGLYPRRLPGFLDAIDTEPEIELAGVMSHFATADEAGGVAGGEAGPEDSGQDGDFFHYQLKAFEEAIQPVILRTPGKITYHCANSAATIGFPQAHFDMVRCGIAVYGLSPFQADPFADGLRPALRLTSYVADVKRLTEGDSVGYGRSWIAPRNTHIAVIPIGYGDGFSRGLSSRGRVLIGGRPYPVVGRVSMDIITADLGGDGPAIRHGDEVVLIGRQGEEVILAEELAAALGTINYEITCNLSSRVERRYEG